MEKGSLRSFYDQSTCCFVCTQRTIYRGNSQCILKECAIASTLQNLRCLHYSTICLHTSVYSYLYLVARLKMSELHTELLPWLKRWYCYLVSLEDLKCCRMVSPHTWSWQSKGVFISRLALAYNKRHNRYWCSKLTCSYKMRLLQSGSGKRAGRYLSQF